jgi:hypothetical protein
MWRPPQNLHKNNKDIKKDVTEKNTGRNPRKKKVLTPIFPPLLSLVEGISVLWWVSGLTCISEIKSYDGDPHGW